MHLSQGMLRLLVLLSVTFSNAFTPKVIKFIPRMDSGFVKEAEFKHARVALFSLPVLAALSATGVHEPVKWLSQQAFDTQTSFFASAGVAEAVSFLRLGTNFSLKEYAGPGNVLGFLNVSNTFVNCELYAGRAAMVCAACVLATGL